LKESCAKNFNDINTARALMSLKSLVFFFEKSMCSLFQQERTSSIPQTRKTTYFYGVAGATRQYFMYEKPRAALCERVFGEPLKIYHGLSFFFLQNA